MTVRLSDPRPAFCSACLDSIEFPGRYVDFEASFDAGMFATRDELQYVTGSDDLHLCERCVRAAMDVLALKPELHARQIREIGRQERLVEYWREYARKLEATLQERPEPRLSESPRRKVAA